MKNKKIMLYMTLISAGILTKLSTLHAEGAPVFNNEEAQEAAGGFFTPLNTFAMWMIPLATTAVLLLSGLTWMTKDEEEREQKPFIKTAKKILIVAIVLEMVSVLLKIFGIA